MTTCVRLSRKERKMIKVILLAIPMVLGAGFVDVFILAAYGMVDFAERRRR